MKPMILIQLSGLGCAAIFFLLLLKTGVRNIRRGWASAHWPVTEAVVTRQEASTTTHRDANRRGIFTTYATRLTIGYQVNDQAYTTDQISWGQTLGTSDASDATLIALRYPEGRRVSVHYNPAKPDEAVIKPGLASSAWWLPAIALAFLVIIAVGGFWVTRLPLSGVSVGPTGFIRATCLLPVFLGLALVGLGLKNVFLARRSLQWPAVEGHWMQQPALPKNADADARAAAAKLSENGLEYIYQYEVNGQTYFNNIRTFGQGSVDKNGADAEIVQSFPRDRALRVAYAPEDPDLAVLRTGITSRAWLMPGIGLAFCAFGIVGLVFMAVTKNFPAS